MENILRKFYQRLANISTKNKSLVLPQVTKRLFIDLHSFHFVNKKPSFFILETILLSTKKIALTTLLDPRDGRANTVSEQLKTILKTHQIILEERGTHDLHIGFPFVTGKFMDGTVVRAPLLLLPVQIEKENNQWFLSRKPDSSLRFNRDFILAYAYRNQIGPLDAILETNFDDFPTEILPFLTKLYEFLKDSVLELNFNRTLFEMQLQFFEHKSMEELKQTFDLGVLQLFPEAILGFFPHHSSFLAADYAHLLEQKETQSSLENYFQMHAIPSSEKLSEESLFLGFPVDASQEETIQEVKKGKSLVVIGPPGSGKSQLISNLITDFTSRGKKVLVVCQKKAALDTVTSRLSQIGLTPFTAQIHDIHTDKIHIFKKLQFQINQISEYEKTNNQLDILALDKQFTWTSRRIQQIEAELSLFKSTLFDTSFCGKSIKELYLARQDSAGLVLDSLLFSEFRADDFSLFLEKIRAFVFFRNQIDSENKHASFFRNLYKNEPTDWTKNTEKELIQQIDAYSNAFKQFKDSVLQKNIHFDKNLPTLFETWIETILSADNRLREYLFLAIQKDKPLISHEFKKKIRSFLTFTKQASVLEKYGQICAQKELYLVQKALKKAEKRTRLIFGKFIFSWIHRSDYLLLNEWLPQNWTTEDLRKLNQHLEATQLYHTLYQEITSTFTTFEPRFESDFLALLEADKIRVQSKKQLQSDEFLSIRSLASTFPTLASMETWGNQVLERKNEWEEVKKASYLLSEDQIMHLEHMPVGEIKGVISLYLPWVAELHRISKTWKRSESELLDMVSKVAEPSEWVKHLHQSWVHFWITRIETQVPILQGVTSKKIDFLEDELQTLIETKETVSQDKIRLALREQCCLDLEKNRLNNLVSYRELGHQVVKKRKTWPLRKLMDVFSDDILKLIPCWLATPEVAAGLFPIQDGQPLFDLVIFDEASQCPVEQGLPLLLRGKQTVITGDPKQLPPFDLYQTRIEHDTEDNVFLEVESLLDAASFLFPKLQLNGHYRSQSIELIQFSNQHFYDNKLELIPDYTLFKTQEKTVFYHKVPGLWVNNQNEREAEEVQRLVEEKWLENRSQNIGVITFNHAQAQIIEKKIDQLGYPSSFVRVKNIENVQGDEFDVVIFSIGYAPNTRQKMANHFGSLSVLGGEKRLNVAITRAKKQLHVVASIWPTELQVEQSKNEGPKLLKAFLAFVLEVTNNEYKFSQQYPQNTLASALVQKDEQVQFSPFSFSDLILSDAVGDISLVLTDDDLYYSMKSTKQAHGYFPRLLRKKNWKFERKWSRNL